MRAEQLVFIELVEQGVLARGAVLDWMPDVMKVIHFVPNQMSADEAASVFLRWLFNEGHEGPMNEILRPED
ncbi:MAG TPA: hypothetical protein VG796_04305 [Verrucomicrobiales bacterium]|nr:hypothetical protein [Verrucomicrobiales bacterium]